MRQCWPFVDPWLVVNSCPATPTLSCLRSTAMHSGFHFAGGRSQHHNVTMTSDSCAGTFADYRYPQWVHICGRPSQLSQRPAMDSCPATPTLPTLRYLRTTAMQWVPFCGWPFPTSQRQHDQRLLHWHICGLPLPTVGSYLGAPVTIITASRSVLTSCDLDTYIFAVFR